jgi:predicted ferric reductase
MKTNAGRTAFWAGCYLLLALGPLAVLLRSDLPSRGFWIEFSAALGFIALAMFALQFVLTARFKGIASPHGLDSILQFHREAGLVAIGFALLHPVIMIVSAPPYIEFLDPRVMPARALLLIGVIVAMLLIVLLTLRRQPLGIPYEIWRISHGLLGLFVVTLGLIHVLQIEWYIAERRQRLVWIGLTAGALLLLGHVRIVKPWLMWKRPYRVAELRDEGAHTWTVALEPVGHLGMRFRPGQFAWLTIGPTPFSLQQHPFSFSSSAADHSKVEFTVRELGDFTSTIRNVKPGTNAFLEGPYGAFVPDLTSGIGLVLIAGGVGIAPMMSILRTLRDLGDKRHVGLIYGSRSKEETPFREDLEAMEKHLSLEVVFIFEEESGRIREELLDQYIPHMKRLECEYFICGPPAMMDMAERYLNSKGVPHRQIHTERFDIA